MKKMIQRTLTVAAAFAIMLSATVMPCNADALNDNETEITMPCNDSPEDLGDRN
ncbi:MAG: hypothetical protein IJ955_04955 [Oscillospiraceae bacterium]|nr:hypothetical protein [Oscillospiraceae bacterium]